MSPSETTTKRGPKRKPFTCPKCHESGRGSAKQALVSMRPGELRRSYLCDPEVGGCGERFVVIEAVEKTGSLDRILVGKAPDRADRFDKDRLAKNLDLLIPKTLTEEERDGVIAEVAQRAEDLAENGAYGRADPKGRVMMRPSQLTNLTLEAFKSVSRKPHITGLVRERHKSARVQYALAKLGAPHDFGDRWWPGAAEFIRWMGQEYDDLAYSAPESLTEGIGRGDMPWAQPPVQRPETVLTVVKNFRPEHERVTAPPEVVAAVLEGLRLAGARRVDEDETQTAQPAERRALRRRTTEDFDGGKLRRTIGLALEGRDRHRDRRRVDPVVAIYEWVMWGLVGQTVVRSSQISAGVADALRAYDDIAYLRWTAIGKELSIAQMLTEAEMLIRYPSPRIEFRGARAVVIRPSLNMASRHESDE